MALQVETWQVYIGLAIIGIFSGLGNALGQYIFQQYIKKHLIEKVEKQINGKMKTKLEEETKKYNQDEYCQICGMCRNPCLCNEVNK